MLLVFHFVRLNMRCGHAAVLCGSQGGQGHLCCSEHLAIYCTLLTLTCRMQLSAGQRTS